MLDEPVSVRTEQGHSVFRPLHERGKMNSRFALAAFENTIAKEKRREENRREEKRGGNHVEDSSRLGLIKTAIRPYYRITLQLRITNIRGNKLQRFA